MAELKQSRWVKVHEKGQANFEAKDNIMDIVIGESRCQADVTYTVRSHKKAAFWLNKYLEAAGAVDVLHEIADQIQAASENKEDVELNDSDKWSVQIEKMDAGIFKVQVLWAPDEPVTIKKPAKKSRKKNAEEPAVEQKTAFSVPKKYMNRVQEAYENSDGFWIVLKNNWKNGESDTIHEDSAKAAVAALKNCAEG